MSNANPEWLAPSVYPFTDKVALGLASVPGEAWQAGPCTEIQTCDAFAEAHLQDNERMNTPFI